MAGIFPTTGVPNSDAYGSIPDPIIAPGCDPLWYSTSRCQPRFDPAAANGMMTEILNLVNCSGEAYDCFSNENLCSAVKDLIQKGTVLGGLLTNGPSKYLLDLDPAVTELINFMTFTVVPIVTNSGSVTISVNGLPFVALYRNDGLNVRTYDLEIGKPLIISFYEGAFYVIGLCRSQVPLVLTNSIDIWVRVDGDDVNGDGTQNTPAKAYRTIKRAFASFASRYATSSTFSVNIRLGMPGDYEAAVLANSANLVNLIGNEATPQAYRILSSVEPARSQDGVAVWTYCMYTEGALRLNIYGITMVLNNATLWTHGYIGGASTVTNFINCRWETPYSFGAHNCIWTHGYVGFIGMNRFIGQGQTIKAWIVLDGGQARSYERNTDPSDSQLVKFYFENMSFNTAGIYSGIHGSCGLQYNSMQAINCHGRFYYSDMNSALYVWRNLPGDQPGVVANGGVFIQAL